jgi:hypothetical protein
MITASVQKIAQDTVKKTSDATEQVALLSDFDMISFGDDGSTMDTDAFTLSERYVSSLNKGGKTCKAS